MELKTISAEAARSNIDEYFKKKEEEEKQKKIKQIQIVFNLIEEDSKQGQSYVDIKLSIMKDEDWNYTFELLNELGYKYNIREGGGIISPYLHISWE